MTAVQQLNDECPGCGLPIQRNTALFEGQRWHYGCLKNTEQFAKVVAICQDCMNYLMNSQIVRVSYDESRADSTRQCSLCGSTHLGFLRGKSDEVQWE